MPGYVIHIAVAQEYLKKHKDKKEDKEEFIKGTIYPDSVKDKSLTHYGAKSSKVVLKDFLKDKETNNSFNRGYFLHLVTDYLFYNKYLDTFSKDIYRDYDIINKRLIEDYKVELPEEVEKSVFFEEGKTKLLHIELAKKVIDEISQLDLEEIEKEIKDNPENKKWNTYNNNI